MTVGGRKEGVIVYDIYLPDITVISPLFRRIPPFFSEISEKTHFFTKLNA